MWKTLLALISVLIIAAVGLGAWYIVYSRSPEYALQQITSALEEKNRLRFQAHVDLDRFLPSAVDQLMAQAVLDTAGSTKSGFEALGQALGIGVIDQLKPALTQRLRDATLEAVENGTLGSEPAGGGQLGESLDRVATLTGATPAGFSGVTGILREGDVALLSLGFRDPHLDEAIDLQLRMEQSGGRWMIVAPENLGAFMERLKDARQEKLRELNLEERRKVEAILSFGNYRREFDRIAIIDMKVVNLSREVTNNSDETVTVSLGTLKPPENSGAKSWFMYSKKRVLKPGESATFDTALYGSADEPIDDFYVSGDLNDLVLDVVIVVSEGEGARVVGPFSSWSAYVERLEDPAGALQARLAPSSETDQGDPFPGIQDVPSSSWMRSSSRNPLDDSPIVTLMNQSQTGKSTLGRAPTLVLRCRDNTTEVYINWGDYLGSDDPYVEYRVGEAKSEGSVWSKSTDSRASFFAGSDIALIKKMLGASQFVARTTPYNESPVTAVFDLTGLEKEIAPLKEACNWK